MAENLVTDSKAFDFKVNNSSTIPLPGQICLNYNEEQVLVPLVRIEYYEWNIYGEVERKPRRHQLNATYSYPIRIYVNVSPSLDISESAVLEVYAGLGMMKDSNGSTRTNSFTMESSPNRNPNYGPFEITISVNHLNGYEILLQMTLTLINGKGKDSNGLSIFTKKKINPTSLHNFLKYSLQLFQNHEFSDVTIKIRGRELPAHKIMLCSSSSVFKAMFNCDFRESRGNTIEIEDFEFEVISEMLEFMYTHKTPQFRSTGGEVDTLSLYKASHKYDIECLLELCRNELSSTFNIESALDVLLLADTYDDAVLKKAILGFICKNPPALDDVPKYEKIVQQRPGLLKDILTCKFQQK